MFSLLTALVMLLTAMPAAFAEALAVEESAYTVVDEFEFPLVNADVTVFEHIKTGAKVMYLANDDTNRAFQIAFHTPALVNTGVPHVFEHATLDGSDKYPSEALFFNLSYQTYNTYMNAATTFEMTMFPLASLSEAQLLKYVDYYADSVFNPLLMSKPSIFSEEAWRYELTSAEDELGLAGTVYSEMCGAQTLEREAAFANYRVTFPGSRSGNDFGGDPDEIYNMSYEDLTNYHDLYYHPSNSLTCLYGAFDDVDAFLDLLDSYFSKYEKAEFSFEDEGYTPIAEPVEATIDFPVENGSDTKNGSMIYYNFVCPCEDMKDYNVLYHLTTLIDLESSPVKKALKEALPAATTGCYVDDYGPEAMVQFIAQNVNPEDAPVFKAAVDKGIQDLLEQGFDKDAVEATSASSKLSMMLTAEANDNGIGISQEIAHYWSLNGNLKGYMELVDSFDLIDDWYEDGTFMDAVARFLNGNPCTSLITTNPVPGLKEQKDESLRQMLAEIKAQMTEEEIAQIVEQTALLAEGATEDTSEMVRSLQAVTVESLPEEIRIFDILDETDENGFRWVNAKANMDGVSTVYTLTDASGFDLNGLQYFKLYTDLLGELDTENYTTAELSSATVRYLYNGVIRVSLMGDSKSCHPYLRCTWTALDEDLEKGYEILSEILFRTKLDDVNLIQNKISALKNSVKSSITSQIYNVQLYRAIAAKDPAGTSAFYSYLNFIEYYEFLSAVEALMAENPEAVVENLKAVQEMLNNSENAVAGCVGNEASIQKNREAAGNYLMTLNRAPIEAQNVEIPTPGIAEGIIFDSGVNYNLLYADFASLDMDGYTGALDAVSSLVLDKYLYPLLRDQYGAYSVIHGAMDDGGVYVISYRDPNVLETFAVYAQLADLMAAIDVDQETLDGYILSSYSYYALSDGELSGGMTAVLNYLDNQPQEKTIEYMKSLKGITVDTIRDYSEMYGKLVNNGVISTAGGASSVNANAGLYDFILNPFGSVDASQVVFVDLPEDHPNYEAARFLYENMLMKPLTDNTFGVDAPIMLGDAALSMYAAIGGSGTPEEAIEFLASYGILPTDPADTFLSNADMLTDLYYFCWALGIDVESGMLDDLSAYADAASIEDPDVQDAYRWFIGNGLYEAGETLNPDEQANRGAFAQLFYFLMA